MNKIQSAKFKMQKSEFINTKPSSPFEGEGKVENPTLRQAQGGDSSTSLTVPEQGRRERSRTTRGGGEGGSHVRTGVVPLVRPSMNSGW